MEDKYKSLLREETKQKIDKFLEFHKKVIKKEDKNKTL